MVLVLLPLVVLAAILGQAQGAAIWWRLPAWSQRAAFAWGAVLMWALFVPGRGLMHLLRMRRDLNLIRGQLRTMDHLRFRPELALDSACESLATARPRLYGMRDVDSPFVLGTMTPAIVLPVGWLPKGWRGPDPLWTGIGEESVKTVDELRWAILHELTHLRQGHLWERLLRVLGSLVLPWEWVGSRATVSHLWRPRWARLDVARQEAEADAWAQRMVGEPAPTHEKAVWPSWRTVPLLVVFMALLAGGFSLLPGRGALAVALGLDVPRYGLLPSGWRLSPALPRTQGHSMVQPRIHLRAGMLPIRPGGGPRLSLEMPMDLPKDYMNANIAIFATLHDEDLPQGSQIEFRWEIDAPASVTMTGKEIRLGLLAFSGPRINYFIPVTSATLMPAAPAEPGLRKWSIVARQGVAAGFGTPRVFGVGFGPLGKGRYILHPPSLERIEAGGQRVPFRTLD